MARHVNLMPWREQRRKERQKAFMSLLGLSAAGAAAIVLLAWLLQAGLIERQESRNRLIERETKEMVKKAEQIQDLDIKRERLLGRKKVIEELQSSRSQMVHLFDQLVRTVPDGIRLSNIQQTGGFLVLEGQAESNSRVSDYLRRLDESEWLEKPDLQFIEAEGSPGSKVKAPAGTEDDGLPFLFKIQVSLVNPTQPNQEGESDEPRPTPEPVSSSAEAPSAPVAPTAPAPSTPSEPAALDEPIVPPAAAPTAPASPTPEAPEPAVAPSQES
jgi:type IV pilus assembly protein PilN